LTTIICAQQLGDTRRFPQAVGVKAAAPPVLLLAGLAAASALT